LSESELAELMKAASPAERIQPVQGVQAGLSEQEARAEAQRCLRCDCGAKDNCRLRHYAQLYGASPAEFRGQRRLVGRQLQGGGVVYEPGKCILCGLCVQVTQAAGEKLGLTFVGRGFDLRVDVPFARPLAEALQRAAAECVAVCPSGALTDRQAVGCGACGATAIECPYQPR
jgi:predicted molibdopterin-dependent oxidoreductase YjgC